MAGKRVTINDVAAAAGVSRQTVTRAMNGMPEITSATRERVLRVGEELGYRPSRFASNLARQKHHSVGLVVATLRNPYYTDLAADFLDVSAARGWQTTMATTGDRGDAEVIAALATQVDAIVGYFEESEDALARAARGVPVVLIERAASVAGVHSVVVDFDAGMADLISQLRARGARSFAMIDSEHAGVAYGPTRRRAAFERWAEPGAPVVSAPETLTEAAAAFGRLRRARPDVDTVVVFNDLMAMGAMQSAHALGLNIPGDIRIVGIDGLSLGDVMFPPLSTLTIDRTAIATAAAAIVAECMEGPVEGSISTAIVPRPLWRMSA